MEKQREKSFILFNNDRKEKENQPDWTGRVTINGVEHWISAWKKTGKSGSEFISGAIGDPVQQSIDKAKQSAGYSDNQQPGANNGGFDDDIPF